MFHFYPYTDLGDINLDWIIKQMLKLHKDWDEFRAVNEITNAGAWDITKQYQAWTVVSDNNAGYISLKPVPAGVAITNIEYWGLIADYNILITNLSNRISVLENDMGNAQYDITVLQGQTAKINRTLYNRHFVVITDSYGNYQNANNRNFVEEAFYTNDITDYHCFVQGGAGFSRTGIANFLNVLQANESVITDKTLITDVVVCGGANDQYAADMSDVLPGIISFITYVKANYPNAKISIGHFSNSIDPTYVEQLTLSYQLYQRCVHYGASYIDNSQYIMARLTHFLSDNCHPTANGIDKLTEYFSSWVNSGVIDVNETCKNFLQNGTNATIQADMVTMIQHNGLVGLIGNAGGVFAEIRLNSSQSITPGNNNINYIIEMSDGFIIPQPSSAFAAVASIKDLGNGVSCLGQLYGNNIELGPKVKLGLFIYPVANGTLYDFYIGTGNATFPIF